MALSPCICLPVILYPEINGIFLDPSFEFPSLQPHNILRGGRGVSSSPFPLPYNFVLFSYLSPWSGDD